MSDLTKGNFVFLLKNPGGVKMSWTMYILVIAFGSVAAVALLSCLAVAKQADEKRKVIFSLTKC